MPGLGILLVKSPSISNCESGWNANSCNSFPCSSVRASVIVSISWLVMGFSASRNSTSFLSNCSLNWVIFSWYDSMWLSCTNW